MSSSQEGSPPPAFEPPLDFEGLDERRDTLLRGDEAYPSVTVESVLDGVMSRKIGESKDEMAAVTAPNVGQAIRQQGIEAYMTSSMLCTRSLAGRTSILNPNRCAALRVLLTRTYAAP
ncbi:hypothetical protein ACFLWA_08490 [Chloroflexota bacterium]